MYIIMLLFQSLDLSITIHALRIACTMTIVFQIGRMMNEHALVSTLSLHGNAANVHFEDDSSQLSETASENEHGS